MYVKYLVNRCTLQHALIFHIVIQSNEYILKTWLFSWDLNFAISMCKSYVQTQFSRILCLSMSSIFHKRHACVIFTRRSDIRLFHINVHRAHISTFTVHRYGTYYIRTVFQKSFFLIHQNYSMTHSIRSFIQLLWPIMVKTRLFMHTCIFLLNKT